MCNPGNDEIGMESRDAQPRGLIQQIPPGGVGEHRAGCNGANHPGEIVLGLLGWEFFERSERCVPVLPIGQQLEALMQRGQIIRQAGAQSASQSQVVGGW